MEEKRNFEGIWIPKSLYLSRNFSWIEKLLILEINSLDRDGKGCYKSNQQFAEFLGVSEGHVANVISGLRKRGIIVDLGSDGRKRYITLCNELKSVLSPKLPEALNLQGKKSIFNDGSENSEPRLHKNMNPDFIKTLNQTSENSEPRLHKNMNIKYHYKETDKITDSSSKGPPAATNPLFAGLSDEEKEGIIIIFEFWNSCKKSSAWRSHRKLTKDIVQAIIENLKHYSVEDICQAIQNYSDILQSDKYYWTYTWSLYRFLTVTEKKNGSKAKKWWKFLPENFSEQEYLHNKRRPSPDPELTDELVRKYKFLINNKKFEMTTRWWDKFVMATERMIEFFRDKSIPKDKWVYFLLSCLEKEYIYRGQVVDPGHLAGQRTWNILMPQYMLELGVE